MNSSNSDDDHQAAKACRLESVVHILQGSRCIYSLLSIVIDTWFKYIAALSVLLLGAKLGIKPESMPVNWIIVRPESACIHVWTNAFPRTIHMLLLSLVYELDDGDGITVCIWLRSILNMRQFRFFYRNDLRPYITLHLLSLFHISRLFLFVAKCLPGL